MPCPCSIAAGEDAFYCPTRDRTMTPHLRKKCGAGQLPAAPRDALACIHRGEKLGEVDCGCSAPEAIYRCNAADVSSPTCTRRKPTKRTAGKPLPNCLGCDQREPVDLSRVTAAITEFKRPAALKRLLDSMRLYYPKLAIDIEPTAGNLSAARNRLAARCKTELMLVMEEDFEFTSQTDLARLLTVIDTDDDLLGVAGACEEPVRGHVAWRHDFHRLGERVAIAPSRSAARFAGSVRYQPCSLVLNFGLFRRDLFQQIPWDENLPVQEHWDFFYRVAEQRGAGRFAKSPGVVIEHHRDRPAGYNAYRGRRFDDYLQSKHGFSNPERLTGGHCSWPIVGSANRNPKIAANTENQNLEQRPNIIVFGVGHSNTTITTRQLEALGWNLGDADAEFAESISIRRLNQRLRNNPPSTGDFSLSAAKALASLPAPWAIKDPRFIFTLDRWTEQLAPYRPVLLWVQKNRETLLASYRRRGQAISESELQRRFQLAGQKFAAYCGPKLTLHAEEIAAACSLFRGLKADKGASPMGEFSMPDSMQKESMTALLAGDLRCRPVSK